jgi:hypothetical protein
MSSRAQSPSRRQLLQWAATGAAACALPRSASAADPASTLRKVAPGERKLLFVVCAYGGASIIDSFMPVTESQVGDWFAAQTLNAFPDAMIEQRSGSTLRTPKLLDGYGIYTKPSFGLGDLVARHGADIAVIGHEVSSVNHTVGQQRALSGAGINRGRTLMEAMALRYGGGMAVPSCNMASDGYMRHGTDPTLPFEAKHELIAAPLLFGAGTHGYKALENAPSDALMARVRRVRDQLDQRSVFARTFAKDPRRERYLYTRSMLSPRLESESLFEKLLLLDTTGVDAKFGIRQDKLVQEVRGVLPNLEADRTEAQIALGFLMAYHGISASVTMGEIQSLMWSRTAGVLDKLISLLKSHDYQGDPSLGKMWDRSLIYVATEFGRDKIRPFLSGAWGTGHHLNNGSLLISPLLKGNAVYGGVDPKTCLTYGCDLSTGQPTPGKLLNESHVYGAIAQALDLDAPAAPKFSAIVRGA